MPSSTTASSRRSGGRDEQDHHTTAAAASEQDQEAIAVAEAIEGFQDDDLGHDLREATVVAVESSNGQQEILAYEDMEQQEQQGQQQEDEDNCGTICAKVTAAIVCIGLTGVTLYYFIVYSMLSIAFGGTPWIFVSIIAAIVVIIVLLCCCCNHKGTIEM